MRGVKNSLKYDARLACLYSKLREAEMNCMNEEDYQEVLSIRKQIKERREELKK